jgi:hypothetical protein
VIAYLPQLQMCERNKEVEANVNSEKRFFSFTFKNPNIINEEQGLVEYIKQVC